MNFKQTITPNPNIPCKPGWCLAYVNEAYGVKKKYGTAIAAWLGSKTQHADYGFPSDLWVPLWFSLEHEPAGHVALRAPDGSVYSTTDNSNVPRRHPNLADLIYVYSFHNRLTYLGWTEDVEDTRVLTQIAGPIIEDDEMKTITLMDDGSGKLYATEDFITKWHIPDPEWVQHYLNLENGGWLIVRRDNQGRHIIPMPAFGKEV